MKIVVVMALSLLLLACAGTPMRQPVQDPEAAWQQHRENVMRLSQWELHGRIAIQTEEEGWNASLHWRQQGADYEIQLDGPLGSGSVRLNGDLYGVTLRSSDEETVFYARDAEELLHRQTGLRVPVASLYYWLRGLPQPQGDVGQTLDAYGHLAMLSQTGWKVTFRGYEDIGGIALPGKVFINNHHLKVRVVVDLWNIASVSNVLGEEP